MKKALLVVALATILVLVAAGSAFAGVNHSGQQRLGAAQYPGSGEPAPVGGGTAAPTAGAGTFTYMDWSTGLGTNGVVGGSPHGNFTTTTIKCVVCHAVHYAAPGMAPIAGGNSNNGDQTADTLLRMKATEACAYCHATAGVAVNGTPVYGGIAPTDPNDESAGHMTGNDCSLCHSSVHGSNEDNSVASLAGYMLKKIPVAEVGQGAVQAPTTDMLDAITVIDLQAQSQGFKPGQALGDTFGNYASINDDVHRQQAVGIFCAECHDGAYATVAAGAATNVGSSSTQLFSGHRIAATDSTDWNADGSKLSGSTSIGSIAWAPATDCRSCHDAPDPLTAGTSAFPHSWGGSEMWLMTADYAGAPKSALATGTTVYDSTRTQLSDGVCLKCHVSDANAGVGVTF